MIRENTIDAVYSLAGILKEKDIVLSPLSDSPISQLMGVAVLENPKGIDESQVMSVERQLLVGSTQKNYTGEFVHDDKLKDLSDSIALIVKNNLKLTRTVINPLISEAVDKTNEFVENSRSVKSTIVSIKPIFFESIFDSAVLTDMVERYNNTPSVEVKLEYGITTVETKEELLEIALTGSSVLDGAIEELFNSISDIFVIKVFNEIFSNTSMVRKGKLLETIKSYTVSERKVVALLIHLFARKLLQTPKKESNIDLSTHRSYVSEILAQSGAYVYKVLSNREKAIANRQLISVWPVGLDSLGESKIVIEVNGDIYNNWLDQGGSPETIFGSFVSERTRSYTELLEKKEMFENQWEKRLRGIKTTNRFNSLKYTLEGLERSISNIIKEMDEEILPVGRDVLQNRLRQKISTLTGPIHERVYETAIYLVCDTIFPHTQAFNILQAINASSKDFPEIEAREAALYATIEIVSNWVTGYINAEYLK